MAGLKFSNVIFNLMENVVVYKKQAEALLWNVRIWND